MLTMSPLTLLITSSKHVRNKTNSIQTLSENRKGTTPKRFYVERIIVIQKNRKKIKRELQTIIPYSENSNNNPQQNIIQMNAAICKRNSTP